jgi:hypothetical protein
MWFSPSQTPDTRRTGGRTTTAYDLPARTRRWRQHGEATKQTRRGHAHVPGLICDPRKGDKIVQRLSLQGNPSEKTDFFIEPKPNEVYDFIRFAKTEGRFSKHFDKDGNLSETLLRAKLERLDNWRTLQELAGII